MATAENGDVVTLYIEGAGATALAVASMTSSTLTYSLDKIDTTAIGDTSRTNMTGHVEASGSVSGAYVHTDLAQARLITLVESATQAEVKYYRSGTVWKEATVHIDSLELNWSDNEKATIDCSFSFNGGITTT